MGLFEEEKRHSGLFAVINKFMYKLIIIYLLIIYCKILISFVKYVIIYKNTSMHN